MTGNLISKEEFEVARQKKYSRKRKSYGLTREKAHRISSRTMKFYLDSTYIKPKFKEPKET